MNKNIGLCLVYLRDIYVHLFKKDILLLEKDGVIIDNKYMLFLIDKLYIFNLKYLLENEQINIIYKLDDMIFYNNYTKHNILKINSIILDAELIIYNPNIIGDTKNIIDNIKRYSLQMPLFIIVKLEKYDINSKLKLTLLKSFSRKVLEYNIVDILYKKLYEIL